MSQKKVNGNVFNVTYDDEIKILRDLKNNILNDDTELLKSEIKKKYLVIITKMF